jgi:hypothetical protein
MFHVAALSTPEPMTATPTEAGTVTIPAMVSATAVPTSIAPSILKTDERTMACPGRAPRVATSVAIAFAASWNPFVRANARAQEIANASSTTDQYHGGPERGCGRSPMPMLPRLAVPHA